MRDGRLKQLRFGVEKGPESVRFRFWSKRCFEGLPLHGAPHICLPAPLSTLESVTCGGDWAIFTSFF